MQPVARTVTIAASPSTVWDTLTDVERWPRWASYMRRLQRLDAQPLGPGSRVAVQPRGLPRNTWTVTEYAVARSYMWEAHPFPGLALVGGHAVTPAAEGCTATFSLAATGLLAGVVSPLLRPLFRRNTRLASDGLRAYCERR